jgi:hypothetical protein
MAGIVRSAVTLFSKQRQRNHKILTDARLYCRIARCRPPPVTALVRSDTRASDNMMIEFGLIAAASGKFGAECPHANATVGKIDSISELVVSKARSSSRSILD